MSAGAKGIDYTRLVADFGSTLITQDLVTRIEHLTKRRAHPWLRRSLFFSHRDLETILNLYATNQPFYLYTGRGPSSDALHLGHPTSSRSCSLAICRRRSTCRWWCR